MYGSFGLLLFLNTTCAFETVKLSGNLAVQLFNLSTNPTEI